ncbi:unnamed protein product [Oreochromis niloticus]|nr:unnamed protein product [Mustela putorius furo]
MLNTKHTVSVAVLLSVITASQDHKIIPAESGQNITLTCRASNTSIVAVEWSKSNMKTDYVLLSRDGHFDLHNQHPSFKDRVDLQDRQMKDGDVSLILNNVTVNDTGTYECRVFMEETHLWKSISTINLSVIVPTGSPGALVEGRSVGGIIGLSVSAVMIFVAFVIYKNLEKIKKIFLVNSCHKRTQHCPFMTRINKGHVRSPVV